MFLASVIIAALVGLSGLSVAIAIMFHQMLYEARIIQGEHFANLYQSVHTAWGKQDLAEKKAAALEAQIKATRDAIESNALPWVPKSELLEHRYENEALDKLENPSISWDTVPDIGRVS